MIVRYTRRAQAQLDEIHSYIESHDPRAARAVVAYIRDSIARLGWFPERYRKTDRLPGVRMLPIVRYPYLVFYTIDATAEEVWILGIRHSSRDPSRYLD